MMQGNPVVLQTGSSRLPLIQASTNVCLSFNEALWRPCSCAILITVVCTGCMKTPS
jgi:hypothetical protein